MKRGLLKATQQYWQIQNTEPGLLVPVQFISIRKYFVLSYCIFSKTLL